MSNVQAGDTALWRSRGVLVHVMKQAVAGTRYDTSAGVIVGQRGDALAWDCEVLGAPQVWRNANSGALAYVLPIYDRGLIPIRDKPGEDEILRLVGKPEGVEA